MEEKQTKKTSLRIGLVILGVAVLGAYLFMRNGCIKNIHFVPENEKPTARGNSVTTGAHYEFWSDSSLGRPDIFQTRNEAISYCMSKKI